MFDAVLQYFSQLGHDFNSGGPNPPGLQYGWLILALRVVGLAVSRKSGSCGEQLAERKLHAAGRDLCWRDRDGRQPI